MLFSNSQGEFSVNLDVSCVISNQHVCNQARMPYVGGGGDRLALPSKVILITKTQSEFMVNPYVFGIISKSAYMLSSKNLLRRWRW